MGAGEEGISAMRIGMALTFFCSSNCFCTLQCNLGAEHCQGFYWTGRQSSDSEYE